MCPNSLKRARLLIGALALASACAQPDAPEVSARERIVLVTLDTLRYDVFDARSMPRTHALAQRAVRFERFYAAAPNTQPTHATIFTGLHPWEHGITRNGLELGEQHRTLTERLDEEGWHTEAVVASYPLHRRFGFAQGFDAYDDTFTFERPKMPEVWVGEETLGENFYSIAESITEKALAALDRADERNVQRMFLWVHYFDAHSPYGDLADAPIGLERLRRFSETEHQNLESFTQRARGLYQEDVRRLDRDFGRLLDRLERDRSHIETHLLVTVDHGESFGEQGAYGHDMRLTPEQIHVPTFLLSPGVPAELRSQPAGSVDVHATLLAMAGLLSPGGGRDLRTPAIEDARAVGMRRFEAGIHAARFYVAEPSGIVSGDALELLHEDDAGRRLPKEERQDLRDWFGRLTLRLSETQAKVHEDAETLRALHALGYGGE